VSASAACLLSDKHQRSRGRVATFAAEMLHGLRYWNGYAAAPTTEVDQSTTAVGFTT
jgi:hypothetical protein